MAELEVEGKAGERRVRVAVDYRPFDRAALAEQVVEIDGERVAVTRVGRYRDGGTTVVEAGEHRIVFPRRMGSPDRTPKLDGVDILGGHTKEGTDGA